MSMLNIGHVFSRLTGSALTAFFDISNAVRASSRCWVSAASPRCVLFRAAVAHVCVSGASLVVIVQKFGNLWKLVSVCR